MSDDGDCRRRVSDGGVAFLHAVYTMYKRWNYVEKAHFAPLFGPPWQHEREQIVFFFPCYFVQLKPYVSR